MKIKWFLVLPLKYYSVLCFSVMSDSMIMDAIASFLVLPNRLVVPLVPGLHVAQLRSPLPRVRPEDSSAHSDYNCTSSFKTLVYEPLLLSQGVVRIHLLEAQKLAAKDNYVKGVMAGLSDPYAILRVGPQTFTSKHIDNTDAPKWGEMYEVRRKVFCFLCKSSARKGLGKYCLSHIISLCSVFEGLYWYVSHWHCPFSFTRLQTASIQAPLSVVMSLCVYLTSGYCPWSTWSRVGGWGIWQRPRQGWFLGQVHMHNSCLGWISCCHLSFVTCMNGGEKYFECTESPFCSVDHWNGTTVFFFNPSCLALLLPIGPNWIWALWRNP